MEEGLIKKFIDYAKTYKGIVTILGIAIFVLIMTNWATADNYSTLEDQYNKLQAKYTDLEKKYEKLTRSIENTDQQFKQLGTVAETTEITTVTTTEATTAPTTIIPTTVAPTTVVTYSSKTLNIKTMDYQYGINSLNFDLIEINPAYNLVFGDIYNLSDTTEIRYANFGTDDVSIMATQTINGKNLISLRIEKLNSTEVSDYAFPFLCLKTMRFFSPSTNDDTAYSYVLQMLAECETGKSSEMEIDGILYTAIYELGNYFFFVEAPN